MNWCSRSRKLNELTSQDDLNGAWPELWKYRRLTRKLRFYLWFATAYWERGTSFTCERRAAPRINKESSCALQIAQRTAP
jgi:hypothetical protein